MGLNTLIGQLEAAERRAQAMAPAYRTLGIGGAALDLRAVFEVGLDHLHDTVVIFQRCRIMQKVLAGGREHDEVRTGGEAGRESEPDRGDRV
jgi:hypothetical protein